MRQLDTVNRHFLRSEWSITFVGRVSAGRPGVPARIGALFVGAGLVKG